MVFVGVEDVGDQQFVGLLGQLLVPNIFFLNKDHRWYIFDQSSKSIMLPWLTLSLGTRRTGMATPAAYSFNRVETISGIRGGIRCWGREIGRGGAASTYSLLDLLPVSNIFFPF